MTGLTFSFSEEAPETLDESGLEDLKYTVVDEEFLSAEDEEED